MPFANVSAPVRLTRGLICSASPHVSTGSGILPCSRRFSEFAFER